MIDEIFNLEDKVFVITGAYGRIGSKVCRFLVENNAIVIAVGRDDNKLTSLKNKIKEIDIFKADVGNEKEVMALWGEIKKSYKKIDILINIAAQATSNTFEKLSKEEWNKIQDVNLTGMFMMCREGVNSSLLKDGSSIINFSSIYGIVAPDQRIYGDSGLNCSIIYAASKGGVIQLTRYLATYLADKKIRVNCISPGGIFNNQQEFFLKNYTKKTPMARMGREEDLFGAITFLSSNKASSYVTGENIIIDGGFTVW